ncbi:unnamed protein product [Tetraodon nigroviridis]|uniref:(spotted green pufferfish) hypothetical protein n=1 Tax=Tetraodon nigroviridis TaxID=99883 RepID=Q4SH22_TETNG|nr:unnamed protein product [Tetraodon nigroviridis]
MSDGDSDEDDASDEENGATDTGDDTADSWEVSAQKGVASWEAAGPASATATANLRNAYSCLACGKVYTYLVPFLKHQLEHKLHSELRRCERTSSSQRYSCSLCGMMFTRKVQLRAHMRIHGPGPVTPQCDQCGKTFASPRTWAAHMELHKQHLFWCLSCSKGFPDEAALDRHLQGHNRKQHTCNICRQSFTKVTELVAHYQGHTTAEAYQCSLCAKSFMFLGNFISHQKQHGRKTEHSSEIRSGQRTGEFSLSRKEKQRIHEPEAAGVGEVKTEESDCGELSYPLKPSNPPVKSEVAPTSAEEVQEKEAGGAHLHGELQYWQWDCCVCDMGFDEVGKLHLHYVKHATGELPIPQEYV